ncbi:phospholipase B1, membrane-associated-like [Haematobia irritans]|uniref:phospholipase B1, membrane-associated-like n=1 Tax=Haematobia irritans TaxID=7368 RepID=UPI003F4FE27B
MIMKIHSLVFLFGFWSLVSVNAQYQRELRHYFLQKTGIQRENSYQFEGIEDPYDQTNSNNTPRDLYSSGRLLLLEDFHKNEDEILQYNRQRGKLQTEIPMAEEFPCLSNGTRSRVIPTSVHQLRPGDIDIIAALGDSLTAGTGILSESVIKIIAEYRGITFTGGGWGDWRSYLTLPNILKNFNPNLYGYALDNCLVTDKRAVFNVGESVGFTKDLLFQAQILIRRLQTDSKVNMQNHWKLISIFSGANDLCSDMCYYDDMEDFFTKHRQNLYETLNVLKENIPKAFIILMATPNLQDLHPHMTKLPLSCYFTHHLFCPCLIGRSVSSSKFKEMGQAIKHLQAIDRDLSKLPEFQTDDFTVIYQPFTANLSLANLQNGSTDFRYFAADCFHYSQLGHAMAANMLWNNLLQREGEKDVILTTKLFDKFECPSENRPYLATYRNSDREK